MSDTNIKDEAKVESKLFFSIFLNIIIVIVEMVGGFISGSLALLSDAFHNLSDVFALIITLVTGRLTNRSPTLQHTYGLHRVKVFSALINSAVLLIVSTLIFKEAIVRFYHPQPINGLIMFWIGIVGLTANLLSVYLLHGHSQHDMNIKGAYLHLLQDSLSSVLVVVAALFSRWRFGTYLDIIVSITILVIIGRSGWNLLREGIHILMEGTPLGLDLGKLQKDIQSKFPIQSIHHIHVWEVSKGSRIMTAHIQLSELPLSEVNIILRNIHSYLAENWDIKHATLEPENSLCQYNYINSKLQV